MRRANALVAALALLALAASADAAERRRLSLPAGRLGDALVALGRQAGISIGVSDPLLAERQVRAIAGTLTVKQALDRLLRGTGARATFIGGDTVRIVRLPVPPPPPRPARRRPPRVSPPEPPGPSARPRPEAPAEEIIVTASKRTIPFRAYPGSATVLGGDDPALADGSRGTDALLQRLPGISSTHLGSGRNKLFIRGIADSSFNGPTQATVGEYFGETRLNYNAPDPDLRLYDVARVEILSGPHGTLYGAGSLGGIIRIVPNPPRSDILDAQVGLRTSATQHGKPGLDAGGVLNLPLAHERAGLRLVGYRIIEGGYIDDLRRGLSDVNRTNVVGGRAAIRTKVDNWTVDLGAAVQRLAGADAQFADRDAPPLTRRSAVAQAYSNRYALGSLVAVRQFGAASLTTAAGVVRQVLRERYDYTFGDNAPEVFDQSNRITLLSAETRLAGETRSGGGWLLGASLIRNRSHQDRQIGPPASPLPVGGVSNAILEGTVFGEGSAPLSRVLMATAGGRFTFSRLSGVATGGATTGDVSAADTKASRTATRFLPSTALSARVAPDLLIFLRYQQGYRPGGLAISGNRVRRFRHDDVAALEAGLRFGRPGVSRFDAAASLAFTRWTDIQADIVSLGEPITANIGDGTVYTLDLKLGWRPVAALSLELAAVFNDSRVTKPKAPPDLPDVAVARSTLLPNVARASARVGLDYQRGLSPTLDLRITGAARYAGKSRLGVGEAFDEEQGDWLDTSLGARLVTRRYAFALELTNLLDSIGNRFALGSPFTFGGRGQITPLRPRTVRIGLEARF